MRFELTTFTLAKGEHGDVTNDIEEVTEGKSDACTNACTSNAENGSNRAGKLGVIADLLVDLPEAERRDVISDLSPTDRVAIARLLIARPATEGKGETP